MKILLVVAEHPSAAEVVQAGADPDEWRIVQRAELALSEPMLAHGLANVCLLDTSADVQGIWKLEQIRKWAPRCPVIVCAENPQPEWIEDAYRKGAFHVMSKPLRSRLLSEVLQRIPQQRSGPPGEDTSFAVVGSPVPAQPRPDVLAGTQGLAVLRGFSGILTHSLDANALLKQFLLFVRELFGLNRVMIFLPAESAGAPASKLKPVSSVGISPRLFDGLELSFESGIGLLVSRTGRIVRRNSSQLASMPEARQEFDALGVEVAIPIPDRENIVGIALVDSRVTGEQLTNAELELLFHLLEQLGLGLRNISLHEQLASNSRMLAGVLRELSSGCVVIDRNLQILHANKTARKFFPPAENRARDFGFEDLPGDLGAKVYQVLHTGTAVVNHRYDAKEGERVFKVNIAPFQSRQDGTVLSVLLMLEDLTQAEHLRKLEVEAAELRLVRPMADRMSSEIGNAIVPIPVFAQLLNERHSDAAFRGTMHDGLMEASRRIERLVNQMRFLIGEIKISEEAFSLESLLEESYQDAGRNLSASKASKIKLQADEEPMEIQGDRAMLKHAFMEIVLNALQTSKTGGAVTIQTAADPDNPAQVKIEFQDNGEGFTTEAARRATEPFFTTRTVGVGLGLTVARRVFEGHGGRIEIPSPAKGKGGAVLVFLPAVKPAKKKR